MSDPTTKRYEVPLEIDVPNVSKNSSLRVNFENSLLNIEDILSASKRFVEYGCSDKDHSALGPVGIFSKGKRGPPKEGL